jgi:hypothetical protein
MEQNYSLAMDAKDYSLADAFLDKIIWLQDQLALLYPYLEEN